MARPSRSRFAGRGPRRQTLWVGPADQQYTAVASGTKVLVASFDAAANGLPSPTLIRTRGGFSHKPTVTTANITYVGAWGVCVVTDLAFTAGAASIPGPFTDAGWDGWLAWGSFAAELVVASGIGGFLSSEEMQVDSKGMRKITDFETVVFMAESETGALDVNMPFRLLFKLS